MGLLTEFYKQYDATASALDKVLGGGARERGDSTSL